MLCLIWGFRYVVLLAANGLTECFMTASLTNAQVERHNLWMVRCCARWDFYKKAFKVLFNPLLAPEPLHITQLTHSHTHTHTHSLTHSLSHSLTHSLTHTHTPTNTVSK